MKTVYLSTIGMIFLSIISSFICSDKRKDIYPELKKYIKVIQKENINKIPQDRKEQLEQIVSFIKSNIAKGQKTNLLFICTHNSRRSHMAQIWAQVAASYYGIKEIYCYSGGTETSAFNPRAIKAMTNVGFKINKISDDKNSETHPPKVGLKILITEKNKNPVYEVSYSSDIIAMQLFSKKYNDASNPKDNFCAIMTCSQADETCPLIEGASLRISIPYEDPKKFDNTPEEEAQYNERCKQIATEMFYIFSLISK